MSLILKIMHLTDLHFNPLHHIPQSRTSAFHKHIRDKWNYVCDVIEEEEINFGIVSGDTFHLKNPKRYYSEDITYYSKLFERSKINWVGIPGNHDMPESSFDQIEKSPYNLLVKATDNLKSIVKLCKVKDVGTVLMDHFQYTSGVEGLNFKEVPINVFGYPYYPLSRTMDSLGQINNRIGRNGGFNILMLHMDVLVDPNIFLYWSVAGYDSILDKLPNVDLLCLGHIHQSFPVYKRINPVSGNVQMVSKPWSFTRVAKDYFNKTEIYEKQHRPSYSLITIEQDVNKFNVTVEYKEIPIAPFEKAFKKDVLKKQIENNIVIKDFIEEVKKNFGSVSNAFEIINPEEYLKGINMSEDVRNMLNYYLEEGNIK